MVKLPGCGYTWEKQADEWVDGICPRCNGCISVIEVKEYWK
jgi:hypothetical protein